MKFIVHSSKPVGKSNCNKTLIAQKRQGDKGELRQQRRTERCATFVVVRRNAEDEMGTRCTELRVSELFAALQEGFRAYSVFYESQTKELQQRLANETEDSDDSLVEEINDFAEEIFSSLWRHSRRGYVRSDDCSCTFFWSQVITDTDPCHSFSISVLVPGVTTSDRKRETLRVSSDPSGQA
ncbi:hypothetical protein L596_006502 [Steinernema carpocapsae]|uniref:Uncharacterized protein n=1 Tax=Steinernema carpocapsae TaxID=34508 RepID=A0A4U8V9C8_STECR|nr:hypothetical protein L596_006502 [Steinernema carpocapsae]